MSNFADYCREKGMLVAENERGFMTAIIHGGVCLVDNFYVKPEYRGSPTAYRLTQAIVKLAEERSCTQFAAEVYKSDPLYHYIVSLHRHFGMSVIEDTEFKTTTAKRINAHDRSKIAIA